jgi:hypothetical protein
MWYARASPPGVPPLFPKNFWHPLVMPLPGEEGAVATLTPHG